MSYDDMLRNMEYLREKADVSYEEAEELLKKYDGNVMRALVELERQGRVYPRGGAQGSAQGGAAQPEPNRAHKDKTVKKTASQCISDAMRHRVIVERGPKDEREVVANLSAPYCAGAAVIAPHLLLGSVALMFVLGYRVRVKKTPKGQGTTPEDVEAFVDRTVSNIKTTASSFAQTARESGLGREEKDEDARGGAQSAPKDDDEGGEVTIE